MTDMLISEVNDALRRAKAEKLWKNNRGLIIALVVAIIVGTAGGQIYRTQKNKSDAAFTSVLIAATQDMSSNKPERAIEPLEALVKESKGEQRTIAALWLARANFGANKSDEAVKGLEEIVAKADRGTAWHDAACVWLAGAKNTWPQECDATVKSPLRTTKLELAAADAIIAKDWEKARSLITQLTEASSDLPMQQTRVKQMALLLPPLESAGETTAKTDAKKE